MSRTRSSRGRPVDVAVKRLQLGAVWMIVAAACCGLLWPLSSAAHGGLSMDSDMCKLRIGIFNMHFAGYQPQAHGNQEFCEDIPMVGETVIVMDAIDPELREMPIEVRLIEDIGDESKLDESQLDAVTVLHHPPKIYETGSIPLQYNFARAGKYVGLITAGDKGLYVSRFPFSVGVEKTSYGMYLLVAGVFLVGLGFYRYAGRARRLAQAAGG